MHEQRDLTSETTDEVEPAARPLRRVDEQRWLASWERFQSAHDEYDASDVLVEADKTQPANEPAPSPADAPATDDAAGPPTEALPVQRANAQERPEVCLAQAAAPPPI